MKTEKLITGLRTTATLLLIGLVAGLAATSAPAGQIRSRSAVTVNKVRVVSTSISTQPRTFSYGWPVKPFERQHPVRANLNDPRIGDKGNAAFHFGIDISAPDGTPVYAVEGGTIYVNSKVAIAVVAPGGSHIFGYWHIVPVVTSHQLVARQQLLGYVGKGWEHLHFAERLNGVYVNPLRDGGLGPYADHTAPTVASVSLLGSALVATAFDTPDPRVPGAWAGEPVTPALLRWRVAGGTWQTAVDFRTSMLDSSRFAQIYTPATRQNHKGKPGCYSFYLQRSWSTSRLAGSPFTIQIAASDIAGNCTVVSVELSLAV